MLATHGDLLALGQQPADLAGLHELCHFFLVLG